MRRTNGSFPTILLLIFLNMCRVHSFEWLLLFVNPAQNFLGPRFFILIFLLILLRRHKIWAKRLYLNGHDEYYDNLMIPQFDSMKPDLLNRCLPWAVREKMRWFNFISNTQTQNLREAKLHKLLKTQVKRTNCLKVPKARRPKIEISTQIT